MNFYKHFLGDYARDTKGLSLLEHGAYRVLLDHNYATEHADPERRGGALPHRRRDDASRAQGRRQGRRALLPGER
jgi:uncharacterized protein YdaU (DUF1376 family)